MKRPRESERGHLMAGLMVAVAIMLILSTVAYQAWEDMIRRDLEAEMIFRAQDICRALKRYRQDHGGQLPLELKLLMEPGSKGQYYLRKLWTDPLVKDGKWGLLLASPQGGIIDPNSTEQEEALDRGREEIGAQSSVASSPPGLSRLNPNQGGGTQDIGGLPIGGVKSLCTKKTFRVINEKSEYALWRFTVFDLEVQGGGQHIGGGGTGQVPNPAQTGGENPIGGSRMTRPDRSRKGTR